MGGGGGWKLLGGGWEAKEREACELACWQALELPQVSVGPGTECRVAAASPQHSTIQREPDSPVQVVRRKAYNCPEKGSDPEVGGASVTQQQPLLDQAQWVDLVTDTTWPEESADFPELKWD